MSKIVADSLASRGGQSIAVDNGVNVTGIVTATSFSGDGAGLTGVSSWESYDSWLFGGGG
jgi:hypothetical protein